MPVRAERIACACFRHDIASSAASRTRPRRRLRSRSRVIVTRAAREPVGDLEREGVGLVAVDGDDQLVALVLVQRLAPGRDPSSPATTSTAKRRRAGRHRLVQLGPGRRSSRASCPWTRRRSARGPARRPRRARPGCRPSCRRPRRPRRRCGWRSRRARRRSAPGRRGRAPRSCSPCGCRLGPRPPRRWSASSRSSRLRELASGARTTWPCIARASFDGPREGASVSARCRSSASATALVIRILRRDEGVRSVLGGEQAREGLHLLARPRGDDLAIWAWTESSPLEGLGDPLGDLLGATLERARRASRRARRGRLELAPDVVDVGRGLLAVEDAGADLDRLRDRLGRRRARLRALADHPRGALVRRPRGARSTSRSPIARTAP